MKGEVVSEDTISHFMGAFEILVTSNFSQEVMRSLSLFITYAFHSQPLPVNRSPRALSIVSRTGTPVPRRRGTPTDPTAAGIASGLKFLTKKQLGVKVLSMYSRILCEKGNTTHIKKFARTVTNKVRLSHVCQFNFANVCSGYCTCLLKMTQKSLFMVARFWHASLLPMAPIIHQNSLESREVL